jgi:hypothetical protein
MSASNIVKRLFDNDDFVPVLGSYPTENTRKKQKLVRDRIKGDQANPYQTKESKVKKLMKEDLDSESNGNSDAIIPDDAEEFDPSVDFNDFSKNSEEDSADDESEMESDSEGAMSQGQEPLMSPVMALTAPDVTPKARVPIDPSELESDEEAQNTQKESPSDEVADITKETEREKEKSEKDQAPKKPETDNQKAGEKTIPQGQRSALDVLLGRNKNSVPESAVAGNKITPPTDSNQALAMLGLGVSADVLQQKILEAAKQEMPMPEPPAYSSTRKLCDITRSLLS